VELANKLVRIPKILEGTLVFKELVYGIEGHSGHLHTSTSESGDFLTPSTTLLKVL